jgi:hypothetical protein
LTDAQKLLADIGAYAGKIDGWFGEKMEAAIRLFQDKASKGERVEKDGNKAEVKDDEKLKGHGQQKIVFRRKHKKCAAGR